MLSSIFQNFRHHPHFNSCFYLDFYVQPITMIAKHVYVKFGLLLGCLNISKEALTKETVNLFPVYHLGSLSWCRGHWVLWTYILLGIGWYLSSDSLGYASDSRGNSLRPGKNLYLQNHRKSVSCNWGTNSVKDQRGLLHSERRDICGE